MFGIADSTNTTALTRYPVSGKLSGKWAKGGAAFDATVSLDLDALAKKSGIDAVVAGSFVAGPGGLVTIRAENGVGVERARDGDRYTV